MYRFHHHGSHINGGVVRCCPSGRFIASEINYKEFSSLEKSDKELWEYYIRIGESYIKTSSYEEFCFDYDISEKLSPNYDE